MDCKYDRVEAFAAGLIDSKTQFCNKCGQLHGSHREGDLKQILPSPDSSTSAYVVIAWQLHHNHLRTRPVCAGRTKVPKESTYKEVRECIAKELASARQSLQLYFRDAFTIRPIDLKTKVDGEVELTIVLMGESPKH